MKIRNLISTTMTTNIEKQFDLLVRAIHQEIRETLGVPQSSMMTTIYEKLRETTNLEENKLNDVMNRTVEQALKQIATEKPQDALQGLGDTELGKLCGLAIRNVLCTLWRAAINSHDEFRLDFQKLLPNR